MGAERLRRNIEEMAEELAHELQGSHHSEIGLEFVINTGESRTSADDADYVELLIFLRKVVCSGDSEALEEILRTLKQCGSKNWWKAGSSSHQERVVKEGCRSSSLLPYRRMKITGKVGNGHARLEKPDSITVSLSSATENAIDEPWQCNARGKVLALPDVSMLLNMRLPGERVLQSNLLHCAILLGHVEMVRCLLKWGADATFTPLYGYFSVLFVDGKSVVRRLPLIVTAAILRRSSIIRHLLESGASPHAVWHNFSWDSLWVQDAAICEALCQHPAYPPPMRLLCSAIRDGAAQSVKSMLPHCRWDTSCPGRYPADLYHGPEYAVLLDMPCFSDAERTCKSLCCSVALAYLCTETLHDELSMQEPSHIPDVIQRLLQVGTDPAGPSCSAADTLCKDWLVVRNSDSEVALRDGVRVKFMSRDEFLYPCSCTAALDFTELLADCVPERTQLQVQHLLPPVPRLRDLLSVAAYFSYGQAPVLSQLVLTESLEDPVVQLLVKHGGIPGLSTADEIPLVDGYLHDGPSCQCDVELSAAQRAVSVLDVVNPSRRPKPLSYLCRAAIIEACQGFDRVKSIHSLGLPPILTSFLLFN
eukprot:scpid66963/ scgid19555/ 